MGHAWEAREIMWVVQVHVGHVILARVGNGRGLHFSAFSLSEYLSPPAYVDYGNR